MYHSSTKAEFSHDEIVRKLVDQFSELTPQQQQAARYLIDHPEEVALNSMRAVARNAGVKPATISRLSRAMGLTYQQLSEPFRQRLRPNPGYANRLESLQRSGDSFALFDASREQELSNLQQSLSDEAYPTMMEAVATLQSSRRIYVLGMRGAFAPAFLFHYVYQMIRENSRLLDGSAGVFTDQLRYMKPEDSMLVVAYSPYTQLTIDALGYAAEEGVSIVSITDSLASPAARLATHSLIAHQASPSFYQSFSAGLSVVQCLLTLLVSQTGDNALAMVKRTEQQLARISAYL